MALLGLLQLAPGVRSSGCNHKSPAIHCNPLKKTGKRSTNHVDTAGQMICGTCWGPLEAAPEAATSCAATTHRGPRMLWKRRTEGRLLPVDVRDTWGSSKPANGWPFWNKMIQQVNHFSQSPMMLRVASFKYKKRSRCIHLTTLAMRAGEGVSEGTIVPFLAPIFI